MYYYIVNPTAGKGSVNQVQEKLRAKLHQLGINGEFVKTTGPGEAETMARAAVEKGFKTIVAVGGDGTVNEVMNGVTDTTAVIGIIPLGKTNAMAKHFGINSWQQACEALAARRIASYNLIAAGKNFFLSTLTIGFETDFDKNIDTSSQALRDRMGRFASSWQQARDYQTLHCRIAVDDAYTLEAEAFTLQISNQKYANPVAENRLVVSIAERPARKQLTPYLWQLLRGDKPLEDAATTRVFGRKLMIETDPITSVMIDGKVGGRTPLAIRLTDRQVRFITEKQLANIKEAL
jgi:diacylglycerol kinase family enzyme